MQKSNTVLNESAYRQRVVSHLREIILEENVSREAVALFERFATEYPTLGSEIRSVDTSKTDLHNSAITTILLWVSVAQNNVRTEWNRVGFLGRLIYRDYVKQLDWLNEIEVAVKSATL